MRARYRRGKGVRFPTVDEAEPRTGTFRSLAGRLTYLLSGRMRIRRTAPVARILRLSDLGLSAKEGVNECPRPLLVSELSAPLEKSFAGVALQSLQWSVTSMLWINSEEIIQALRQGNFDQARSLAETAMRTTETAPVHWADLAGVLAVKGDLKQSEHILDGAIERFDVPFLFCFRAWVRHAGKHFERAIEDLMEAERRSPGDPAVQNNIAAALMDQDRHADAAAWLLKILSKYPDHLDALSNLAAIYTRLKRYDEAVEVTRRRWHIRPDDPDVYLTLLNQLRSGGLLQQFEDVFEIEKVKSAFAKAQRFETFHALTYLDDPAWHRLVAQRQALTIPTYDPVRVPTPPASEVHEKKLRIGYWSNDYYDHATVQLISEAFELHDRSRFEIFLLSYSKPDVSPARQRLERAADGFFDFHGVPDGEAVDQIADLGIDILVDLKGYTQSSRMAIPFSRPAPIVASWLGYPGTLGSSRIDYIIGDSVVTPPGSESWYEERGVRLSDCYQPNDRRQVVEKPLSRQEYDLPADAVVIAAFNATHKISPEIFAIWMRVLKLEPRACLWLFAESEAVFGNLVAEAARQGVSADRIVHADTRDRPGHMARYKVADFAVDCFPYGSHTTGSDALRAGCPLVALQGQSFASRVSASLLEAAGVPDLVAGSLESYEDLLHRMAGQTALRESFRVKLKHVSKSALFDTPAFVASLERAYRAMWRDHVGSKAYATAGAASFNGAPTQPAVAKRPGPLNL